MKEIHIFEAEDGSRFDNRSSCESYETLCECVNDAMAPLGIVDISGPKFYQHMPIVAQEAARAFTKIAVARLVPSRASEDWHPHGIIQRFIDNSSIRCLSRASSRIGCIDLETGREYEQPYFRLHPNEATECVVK